MNETPYILHYAPDNASLVIRLALEEIGASYQTKLVDRSRDAQRSEQYLSLNPDGKIPVLETADGSIFETAAILLWLADRHGKLAPAPNNSERADCLKWLFFMSNTLHPALRRLFYPTTYVGEAPEAQASLATVTRQLVVSHLRVLEARYAKPRPGLILDLYLAPMLRWLALYPKNCRADWFDITQYAALHQAAADIEARPSTKAAQHAEGLGKTPFTAPQYPDPPEGSAI